LAHANTAEDLPMILVLDDEEAIRSVVARLLQQVGFSIVTAATGSAALDALKTHNERIVLMIVDIKLPDMCGREFVHHATARHGERPILYFSGVDQQGRTDALHQRTIFLAKPFEGTELIARVRTLIADARHPIPGRSGPDQQSRST
jgi:DNA-binding response OmpR family regulator